jgi:hypothetical protein
MDIAEKTLHFRDGNVEPDKLAQQIQDYLESDGFHVHSSQPHHRGTVIQAKKGGLLSKAIDADRALTVVVSGTPGDISVRVGIGKWVEHIAIGTIEAIVLPHLFIAVDVAEVAWNFEIENKLVKEIESFAGSTSAVTGPEEQPAAGSQP